MSEPLDVWLGSRRIGALSPTRRGARFHYLSHIVEAHRGLPLLSASFPVQDAPFDAERTRAWFSGLLPEDEQRDEVARRFNLQSGSYLDMLREIGWECAGATTITPSGDEPSAGSLRALSDADLARRLAALPARPFDDLEAIRISLGGYQAKMLTTLTDDGWALPVGGAPSTHIMKPATERWPHLIQGEAWAMTAAGAATTSATVSVLFLPSAPPTLVVERFDRDSRDGSLRRIHQEDTAQALGIPPERKYASRIASRSDASFRRIAGVLDRYSSDPRAARRRLLEQVVVNVALGNTDDHAKNIGLVHPTSQTIELSPLYDVAPTVIVNPATLDMGLRVADTVRIDRVTTAKLIEEARSWGMRPAVARSVVETTLDTLRSGIARANERYPDAAELFAGDAEDRIRRLLEERRSDR